MAHFAEIDENNIVKRVLVVSNDLEHRGAEFLSKDLNLGGRWIQTSYSGSFRKNFAGVNYFYDEEKDVFIPPQPFASWHLDNINFQWHPPKPYPIDGANYFWDEAKGDWLNV